MSGCLEVFIMPFSFEKPKCSLSILFWQVSVLHYQGVILPQCSLFQLACTFNKGSPLITTVLGDMHIQENEDDESKCAVFLSCCRIHTKISNTNFTPKILATPFYSIYKLLLHYILQKSLSKVKTGSRWLLYC